MVSKQTKAVRCAIYTRKSTEHGLELEFNSLDAQREACEAYIKSQAAEGWRALPDRYDDPAISGGTLERPSLQRLLQAVEAGKVDVIVVYKIDRLTRSLTDFAKLVELFDARGISFVAVTQQFNTTTSMGRLTLNVLLSFAQFERELSSERVRDKVAASRRRGLWTGGNVPLGYDCHDKKLVVNAAEAEAVRAMFKHYLELRSVGLLIAELKSKNILTKKRVNAEGKMIGGIPLAYGTLAYLLKNRTYLGEIGHRGTWFPGEHQAIVERETFESAQDLMRGNAVARKHRRSESGALLMDCLFDDRGNRMSPSFSSKKGVRYRFYLSSPLLKGDKEKAGSLPRVSAPALEGAVVAAVRDRPHLQSQAHIPDRELLEAQVGRIEIGKTKVRITFKPDSGHLKPGPGEISSGAGPNDVAHQIELPWSDRPKSPFARIEEPNGVTDNNADPALLQAIVWGHAWIRALSDGTYTSVEDLASSIRVHPKTVRNTMRLAFLAPDITKAILFGDQPATLTPTKLQAALPLSWMEQQQALGIASVLKAERF